MKRVFPATTTISSIAGQQACAFFIQHSICQKVAVQQA
jgi:hypothetical protein